MGEGLRRDPIGPNAVHVCLDMQRLFAPGGPWPTPWALDVIPAITELAARAPARTVFTCFLPPEAPDGLPGTWQRFYRKWHDLTRSELEPGLLDLVPEVARFVPPAHVVDKSRYSAFSGADLLPLLTHLRADTLIFSGAETDVCVLATLFDAVDLGFRVILAGDAVCSSSDTGHDAIMAMLQTRLSIQVEVARTEDILNRWERPAL